MSAQTRFTVQFRDLSLPTEVDVVTDPAICETCGESAPGVADVEFGVHSCTGCFLQALALGVVRVLATTEAPAAAAPVPTECGICGRPADAPYRRVIAGIVTEGCVAPIHPLDAWSAAYRLEAIGRRLSGGEDAHAVFTEVNELAAVLDAADPCRDARNIGCRLAYVASRSIVPGNLTRSSYVIAVTNLVAEARGLEVSPAARTRSYSSGLAIG